MRNYMNKTKTKLYTVWRGAKERCTNPNHKNYNLYKNKWHSGWNNSDDFIKWANENGYKEGLTIDRIDPNKGYSPENWFSMKDSRCSCHLYTSPGSCTWCEYVAWLRRDK